MDKTEKPLKIHLSASRKFPRDKNVFKKLAEQVAGVEWRRNRPCRAFRYFPKAMNIKLMTNSEIRKVNKEFLGRDCATDVISFSYLDEPVAEQDKRDEDSPVLLGEVAVSFEMASQRCREYKKSFKSELALYIIHGVLHVFGYDDQKKTSRQKMEKKQKEYLKKYMRDT